MMVLLLCVAVVDCMNRTRTNAIFVSRCAIMRWSGHFSACPLPLSQSIAHSHFVPTPGVATPNTAHWDSRTSSSSSSDSLHMHAHPTFFIRFCCVFDCHKSTQISDRCSCHCEYRRSLKCASDSDAAAVACTWICMRMNLRGGCEAEHGLCVCRERIWHDWRGRYWTLFSSELESQ